MSNDRIDGEEQTRDPVAAICYKLDSGRIVFCFVRSSAGSRIFPKGKVKKGESAWHAAEREAEEEAGVTGVIRREELTTYSYFRPKRKTREQIRAFLLEVSCEQPPSENKRDPVWWDFDKALRKFSKKKYSENEQEYIRVLRLALDSIPLP